AGIEGGIRAMEDLVTWAACSNPTYAAPAAGLPPPACAVEGPFPKKIVESATQRDVPTAAQVLDQAVIYFVLPNPDGWARGQVSPVEVEDGSVNTNYAPGFFFQRYNGNGVDLNRDFPTRGYSFKPYSPGSEPETKALTTVLRGIRESTSDGQFTGGIDLHGMLTSHAFSYTLIGAGQRDYRKNALTVDTSVRTWEDQTQRMAWSPYVADANANGVQEEAQNEFCFDAEVSSGTRGHAPACVADEWGTVIDTIGYQISGGIGDWFDSPIGLGGIGINNEMFTSHLAPNTVFEPALEQTHIDGNKGLIFSQLASLLTSGETTFDPTGKVGYVYNPTRLQVTEPARAKNPGLPSQNDIDVTLPCQSTPAGQNIDGACGEGTFGNSGATMFYEFAVKGPNEGIWNGGLTATYTGTNAAGTGVTNLSAMQIQHFVQGQWQTVAYHFRQGGGTTQPQNATADLYLPTGQVASVNDPLPGRYRIFFQSPYELPGRLRIDFENATAEGQPDQVAIDASSMDFFDELNQFVPEGEEAQAIPVNEVLTDPTDLSKFDSIVVVNNLGRRAYVTGTLGLSGDQATTYFQNLRQFASRGGNLVLTDAALNALPEIGVVPNAAVREQIGGRFPQEAQNLRDETTAGNYAFQIDPGVVTYRDPARFPLAENVGLPGAAEQELGRRQAVEPSPLGYSPDYGFDRTPGLSNWGVDRAVWQQACGTSNCIAAMTQSPPDGGGDPTPLVNLGQARLGHGTIRIAGIMLPDPVYGPDGFNDHRYGVADYALTYTGWEVFQNLIDYVDTVEYGVDVACTDCPVIATGGTPATAQVAVTNRGNVTDAFDLSVASAPAGWTASVDPATVDAGPGASVPAAVSFTVPSNAAPGTYEIGIGARSQTAPEVSDVGAVTVDIPAVEGVSLSCDPCSLSTRPGVQGTGTYVVTNTGNVATTYDLKLVSVPKGWTASIAPVTVTLGPGASQNITLSVTSPRSQKPGTFEVVARATARNSGLSDDGVMTVEVRR
ncbi:MAG: NEW3 domain-containing protein, partial [Actinomycetota bacterium]|nr:NEW3 domain-containing protein [Actinomycetota bacterium]